MNKKLLVVAVAGALSAPALALAQASNVQLYGRANLGFDSYSATGATAGSGADWNRRNRVYDNGSRFGLRGSEDLGSGLKAIFLMESGVAMDTGNGNGQSGGANTSVGLAARIGYVGLSGGWGQLTFGRQNVWWGNGQNEQWQANYGSVGNQFFTGGFGRGMGVGVARVSNTMQYLSPTFAGINATVSYSPNNQETVGAGNVTDTNGRLWGLSLNGTHGQFIWGWDWVNNQQNSVANVARTENTANKLKGGWFYQPGAQVSLFWIQNQLKNGGAVTVDATASSLKQNGWGIVWEHTWGNVAVEANYSKLGNISGCNLGNCNNTGNTAYFLGGRYALSKRTSLLAFYLNVRNDSAYNADVPAGGMSSIAGAVPVGADPKVYGVGMLHNF